MKLPSAIFLLTTVAGLIVIEPSVYVTFEIFAVLATTELSAAACVATTFLNDELSLSNLTAYSPASAVSGISTTNVKKSSLSVSS